MTVEVEPAGSSIVSALERTWEQIRSNHPELPAVVIVTGSGLVGFPRWGHFRADGWVEKAETNLSLGEMFVAGEIFMRGAAHTVETMLHEAVHVLAKTRKVKDTSRQGRWHNQVFRKLAEEMGLEYQGEKADPKNGFSDCRMSPGTWEDYDAVIQELDSALRMAIKLPGFVPPPGEEVGEYIHGAKKPREGSKSGNTNNLKAVCGCSTPRIIRVSRKVLEDGDIMCARCGQVFQEEIKG